MDIIVHLAQAFMNLFQTGASIFISWTKEIVPVIFLLIVAMNSLISFVGEKRINKLAVVSAKNPLLRYMVLPFIGSFMLGNPMVLSLGRFLPERYKPSYYASGTYFCHTSNGLFPHINPGELFIFIGITVGIQKLGLNTTELAVRYLLVGLVMNFLAGWITDFTTKVVEKQQGIKLKTEVKLHK
jgi:PTS system glucitol/sorbitol-specific IIC component